MFKIGTESDVAPRHGQSIFKLGWGERPSEGHMFRLSTENDIAPSQGKSGLKAELRERSSEVSSEMMVPKIRLASPLTLFLCRRRERRPNLKLGVIALVAMLLSACAPRENIYGWFGKEKPVVREFPDSFLVPQSNETEKPVWGWGGASEGEPGGVFRTPVIFIHGNTVSATYWNPVREYFLENGYTADELWAVSYGWNSVRAFDGNDLSVPTIEKFVNSVLNELSRKTGRKIQQVDVIAHSLGVTLVRQWMKQHNRWHTVRKFIGACGANHGVWTAGLDARGQNRVVGFELAHGSPWLKQLNAGGETPGPTEYMTLYDGNGWGDVLFPPWSKDSPALAGAKNVAYNVENGTGFDHLELPREPETMDAMLVFLGDGKVAAEAKQPRILRSGELLQTNQPSAQLHCDAKSNPTRLTPGRKSITIQPGEMLTCFAANPVTGLASRLQRFSFVDASKVTEKQLRVTAQPPAGVYENPQFIQLSANDPEAMIVYSTSDARPSSGSPLYQSPVYVPGPLTLSAVAITPDGRQSEPLQLEYDISIEYITANRSLQRQYDDDATLRYVGKRKKGN